MDNQNKNKKSASAEKSNKEREQPQAQKTKKNSKKTTDRALRRIPKDEIQENFPLESLSEELDQKKPNRYQDPFEDREREMRSSSLQNERIFLEEDLPAEQPVKERPHRQGNSWNSHGSDREKHHKYGHHRERNDSGYSSPQGPGDKEQSQKDHYEYAQHGQGSTQLEDLSLTELLVYARRLGIVGATLMRKHVLIDRIKYIEANPSVELEVEGVLEKLPDGFGFLRSAQFDYISGPDDVYVSPSQIRRFGLRTGDTITGVIRKPKENEKYFALLKVKSINYQEPNATADRMFFDRLSPLHPDEKFNLEYDPSVISTRIMDMFTPIGKGQRGLIVAPPKVGKTMVLKQIAQAFTTNYPDSHLIVLLIDERPEEVTDMRRTVRGTSAEVVSSTFDEAADRHVQVAEVVLAKAKRLVESGKDVVILLDSLTRLARAYNTTAPASGKVLTGGIDANALQRPKRFFGAARNTEEAGSLTIIASAMIDTGSRMDEVIYEEFKGTGNMEIHMSRKLSNRRIYPAFDLLVSGTRREDLLLEEEDLKKVWVLQKFLSTMNIIEGMEFLIDKMKKLKTNREFLDSIQKKMDAPKSSGGSNIPN